MVMLNSGGNWLKSADVKKGDVVTFKDEGVWQENNRYNYPDGNPRMDFVIAITHNGEKKAMRLNQTNRTALIEAFGNDTSKWVGKSVKLDKMMTLVAGKRTQIVVVEVSTAGNAKPPIEEPLPEEPDEEIPF